MSDECCTTNDDKISFLTECSQLHYSQHQITCNNVKRGYSGSTVIKFIGVNLTVIEMRLQNQTPFPQIVVDENAYDMSEAKVHTQQSTFLCL